MSGITCGAGMSMNPETSPSASDIAANEQHNSPGTHALTNHTMADHLLSAAHQQAAQQMLKKSRSDDPYLIGKAAAFGTARTASTENTTVLPSTSSSSSIRSEKPPRVGSYHSTASSTHSSHHAHQNMSQQPPPHYHGIPVSRSSDTTSVYKSSKQYHAMGGSQEFDHDHHTFATATTASATISYSTDEVDHVNSDVSEVGMEVVMDDSNNNSNPEQAREQQILSLLDRSKSKERHHRTAPSQPYVTHSFPAGKHTFTIDQRYHFIRVIGSGAYGVVISAKDSQTNADIAIKMVPRAFHDEVDAKRILREIKLLKHFQHENIVTIMDMMPPGANYVEDYHDVYMITDLMETDLHRIIYSKQKLSLDHVQYFVYQVLRGLKYIHSCNVLHRDLKPSNLLVNSNCDLKICDFGLARGVYDSNAMDGPNGSLLLTEYVVTRWYRAPEIMLACHEYSKPIDIWSVGCIFAELILRKPYFPGDDYIDQVSGSFGIFSCCCLDSKLYLTPILHNGFCFSLLSSRKNWANYRNRISTLSRRTKPNDS